MECLSFKLGIRKKIKASFNARHSLINRKLSRAHDLHKSRKPNSRNQGIDNKKILGIEGVIDLTHVTDFKANHNQNDAQSYHSLGYIQEERMKELSERLAFICERLKTVDEEDLVQTEWRTVAMTIDRMIFIVLAVICGATILGCALYIPQYAN